MFDGYWGDCCINGPAEEGNIIEWISFSLMILRVITVIEKCL